MAETTKQVAPNPTGKGGFAEHPENRNDGRWDKNNSQKYWINYFMHLTKEEFEAWKDNNPPATRTMASEVAYNWVRLSGAGFKIYEVITNRAEGMPKQEIEMTDPKDDKVIDKLEEIYGQETTDKTIPDKQEAS